jgi:hypothetical protein
MRVSARLGKGIWITGGGGVLAFALAASVFRGITLAAVALAGSVVMTLAILTIRSVAAAKGSRKALLGRILAGSVEIAADEAVAKQAKVWGVYAVGGDFHHGLYPDKGLALKNLYPSQARSIALICTFADSQRASKAATALRRHGFSFDELLKLFPEQYRPAVQASKAILDKRAEPNLETAENTMLIPEPDGRDLTKYRFDGQTLGKGRLALALIKRYASEHREATFGQLRVAFPDHLQANSPIQFSSAQNVVARLDAIDRADLRRYFTGDGEPIELLDTTVVVSREWNRFNIQNLLQRARDLGYVID